jgi:hypothetical protein
MIAIPKGQKKAKKPTLARLKKEMDAVFSEWIRRKDAINGLATCVTCGTRKPWKEMQAGHFISRVHLAVRWDEQNVHVQDARCNIFLSGNYVEYAIYMVENYGYSAVQDLNEQKHRSVKYSRSDYETMISDTKAKLQALDEERMAA